MSSLDMSSFGYILAAIFLPLFPASMLFNWLFFRIGNVWLRSGLLLVWPQLGLWLLAAVTEEPPVGLIYWGVLTAGLYAFRACALRDFRLWTAHMATSSWALLWLAAAVNEGGYEVNLQAAAFSAPFVLLAWFIFRIESSFGAAYAGAVGGLALTVPRLAGVLVMTVLAAVATPLFPGFFVLLQTITQALMVVPGAAVMVLGVWLLWAWAGTRILQGLVFGPASSEPGADLAGVTTGLLGSVLLVLVIAGIAFAEGLA